MSEARGTSPRNTTARRAEWLVEPLSMEVERALDRLAKTEDVVAIAVMPDVHLSNDVCIGTVTATGSRLLPHAVGGDIGCGMQAVAFDVEADRVDDASTAAMILSGLYASVPILRHHDRSMCPLSESLQQSSLSSESLERRKRREAALQLGTLGRGNHFVELQRDQEGRLWAMAHSGSRGMGQAIRDHHVGRARSDLRSGLEWLSAEEQDGLDYLHDVDWARRYAKESRTRILERVVEVVGDVCGASVDETCGMDADHNHVQRELCSGERLWVHRKGAQAAREGEAGIVPGSMGSQTFHVVGRGCVEALASSSHGAGRTMSRTEARRAISRKQLVEDTVGVWYDHRLEDRLREEAPGAYKDIGAVMRAQRELVRIVRRLSPVLVYKGV